MEPDAAFVIYDRRVRWVAAINMAFFVAFIWYGLRYCTGVNRYIVLVFSGGFCLFWSHDLIFGIRLKLLSDGRTLQWQDGKQTGSVRLAEIRRVLIGARKPIQIGSTSLGWTYVRFLLRDGSERELPPNLAQGLRARKWKQLKRMVSHIRTVCDVPVEPIGGADMTTDGWQDEPNTSPNGGPAEPPADSAVGGEPA
jgi:hypothetical protein